MTTTHDDDTEDEGLDCQGKTRPHDHDGCVGYGLARWQPVRDDNDSGEDDAAGSSAMRWG